MYRNRGLRTEIGTNKDIPQYYTIGMDPVKEKCDGVVLNRTKSSADNPCSQGIWTIDPQFQVCKHSRTNPRTQHRPGSTNKWRSIHNAILRLPTTLLDLQILGPQYQPRGMLDVHEAPLASASTTKTQPFDLYTLGQPSHFSSPAPRKSGVYQDSMPSDPSFLMQGVLKLNHLKTNSNPSTVLVHSSAHPFVCLSVALVCSPRSLVRSPCLLVCSFVVISSFFLSPHPLVRSRWLVLS